MVIEKDIPIYSKSQDILNRDNFVNSIVQLLQNNNDEESTVIGLYGPWGSGKTSIINLIQEQLNTSGCMSSEISEDTRYVIVTFNPWLYSNMKDLIVEFFTCMTEALGQKGNKFQNIVELLNEYKCLISPISNFIGILDPISQLVEKSIEYYVKQRNSRSQNLVLVKKNLIQQMVDNKQKIVVFIDDIDRLTDEEIAAIFRLVKVVADFPFVTYILSFDYEVVINALDRVQHDKGVEYLEKIVQVPVIIPSARQENLEKYFNTKLESIFCDESISRFQNTRWWQLRSQGIDKYMTSIRNINRYCNEVKMSYYALKGDINIIDLLGISCLRVFESHIYQILPRYKKIICINGNETFMPSNDIPAQLIKMTEVLKNRANHWNYAESILGVLFPKFSNIVKNRNMSIKDYKESSISFHSIQRAENFDRYFTWTLTESDVSFDEIHNFLFECDQKQMETKLLGYKDKGLHKRFIEELDSFISNKHGAQLSEEQAKLLVRMILSCFNTINEEEKAFVVAPLTWYVFSLVETLLKGIADKYRIPFIKDVFSDETIHIAGLAMLLDGYRGQVRNHTGGDVFNEDEIRELERLFVVRGQKLIESDDFYDDYGLKFLNLLKVIAPDVIEQYKEQLMNEETSLVKVLEYCIYDIQSSCEPYYFKRFNKHQLEEFILPELAYQRIKRMVNDKIFKDYNQVDKETVIMFMISMEQQPVSIGDLDGVSEDMILDRLRKLQAGGYM